MKTLLTFAVCFSFFLCSCRRDHYEEILPTAPVVDFRDTVCGDYTGTMHYVRTTVYGTYTVIDTTYPYTLHVATASANANSLSVDGITMDANSNYVLQTEYFWGVGHPRQNNSGQFYLYPLSTHLNFTRTDSWQGTADSYTFQGDK